MAELDKQLRNYRLTLAEITYFMPDYPGLIQQFIWQDYDLMPEFPVLNRFLKFWDTQLDAQIHSVSVAGHGLITPGGLVLATEIGKGPRFILH